MDRHTEQTDAARILELLKTIKPEQTIAILRTAASLTPDVRQAVLEYLENEQNSTSERVEHEPRMRATMSSVAKAVGLQWDDRTPSDHPFHARLDGALMHSGIRVAIVELEAKNRKQIDGALLDLLTHPEPRKVLVIGRSKVVPYPSKLKREIVDKVLPVLQRLLKDPAEIGVFTESELRLDATLLAQFIGI